MAHIQWYGSESDTYRKIVRNNPGIGAYNFARMMTAKGIAEAKLEPHHRNHDRTRQPNEPPSSISVTKGSISDAFLHLDDPKGKALIIEGKLGIIRGAVASL